MTKEKLLKNLRKQFDEFGWALDMPKIQDVFIEKIGEDLDKFESTVKKSCVGPQTPTNIDLQGIENAG